MQFDEAKIYVKAGDGGDGVIAFRREAHVPRGGPSGGNGGKGGDVYVRADSNLNTLLTFHKQVHFRAGNGEAGRGKNQTGAAGADLIVAVPPGTVVYDAQSGEQLSDLTEPGAQVLIARGGRGGRGNRAFRSPTNQAPRIAENGEPGPELWLRLELKLLADVGFVGVPNAGKSTLLAKVSAARPKIADYAFTTLEPNLGVVVVDNREFVAADIPGLIEGAHSGAGLGHQFLRHVERTRLLVHLINGLSPDPLGDYDAINQELSLFTRPLSDKQQIVAFNKIDMPEARAHWPEIVRGLRTRGVEDALAISALTGEGVDVLLRRVVATLAEMPVPRALPSEMGEPERAVIGPPEDKSFSISRDAKGVWHVRGAYIEKIVAMTKWDYYQAVMRFQRIMEALGITQALRDAGVREGDTVQIGEMQLDWSD